MTRTDLVSVSGQMIRRDLGDKVQRVELAAQDVLRDRHSRVDDRYAWFI
jgi:hypothetical protein